MAIFLPYDRDGEDDAMVQGAEWLQNVIGQQQGEDAMNTFSSKFKELHEKAVSQSYDCGPVFDLFMDYSEDLFNAIPEARGEEKVKDVESFFALVLSMLLMLEDTEHLDKATTRLCEVFSKSTDRQPELRLRLLMMLYNTFKETLEFRYRVFKYILDYAAKAGLFDQVLPYLEFLDAWMADWDSYLTVDQKRTLYRDIATYMRQLGKRLEAFQHLKRYHLSFQGAKAAELTASSVTEATIELIKDAVQLPVVIQFDDILGFDTVKALSKGKNADLVKLCDVFFSGTVNDLRSFQKSNSKIFDEHGMNFQDAMSKIRLLTLASLAHAKSEIGLSEVAKALEEEEENVEKWVVRAISEGVIDGRIDQLNRKVLVKSSFQRKFEKEEWSFLDSKLTSWIDNLENVIAFIGEQKTVKAQTAN